jgi:uncharacterized membrane protein
MDDNCHLVVVVVVVVISVDDEHGKKPPFTLNRHLKLSFCSSVLGMLYGLYIINKSTVYLLSPSSLLISSVLVFYLSSFII